jgi:hypothetical protein
MRQARLATILSTTLAIGCTAAALGQASNQCVSAPVLNSYGTYPFNTKGATTDGAANALCAGSGSQNIFNDVWLRFRAPETFIVDVQTCGLTTLNTKIAVYRGAECNAPVIACSDDACGTQSKVTFDAVKGQIYLIRVGANVATGFGSGSISIAPVPVISSATNSATGIRYVIVRPTSSFTWLDAVAYAPRLGGYLATIDSQAEQDFVAALAASSLPGGSAAWIGLNDRKTEGAFEWVEGSPASYSNWFPEEPNNIGDEDCVELWVGSNAGGKWNDHFCNTAKPAIIEIPAVPTFLVDVVNPATNKRYVAVSSRRWLAAESLAVALSGHLVSIGSPAEQAFVQSNFAFLLQSSPAWIGLTDRAAEGTFVWTDGTPLSFSNWSPGEPNNAGDEDAVDIRMNGQWNDLSETMLRPALFELPVPTPMPCPGDLDGDRSVSSSDLGQLLSAWGTSAGDLDGDGVTNSSDLGVLLAGWGNCP